MMHVCVAAKVLILFMCICQCVCVVLFFAKQNVQPTSDTGCNGRRLEGEIRSDWGAFQSAQSFD